jgi:hypothetical protein
MMEVVGPAELLGSARSCLGLSEGAASVIDEGYLATSLRRLAGFLCPCSPATLLRWMLDSHRGLAADPEAFGERVEGAIEALVAIGDLLELREVALESEEAKGTWLVAAPPSFVSRASGDAFILGLAVDEQTPLPSDLRGRVRCDRAIRSIAAEDGEELAPVLRALGLRELSEASWLKAPKKLASGDLIATLAARLSAQPPSGEVPDLLVLDHGRQTKSYRRRWGPAGSLSGCYVVRRPQAFGADLWGYAELRQGEAVRLLDLPLSGDRWRGCDAAWRIQLAIDARAGRPQEYRRVEGSAVRFDLFAPIPLWARRRLSIVGEEVEPEGCLMSFKVQAADAAVEEQFLKEQLYLVRSGE